MSEGLLGIFGEVLFDVFPGGRHVLGGAPFNVAWHLQAFGQSPLLISRVGTDAEGDAVRAAMQAWGLTTAGLQTDARLPTGRVQVQFTDGEPSYSILHPAAFDAIAAPEIPSGADSGLRLLYHGSLALRDAASRASLARLRATGPEIIFIDVNLRAPWWRREDVLRWGGTAHWVKLNHHELEWLSPGDIPVPDRSARFLAEHDLAGLVVTSGDQGATVVTAAGNYHVEPDRQVEVVDTVGAGDAFAAVMILGLMNDWPLDVTLSRAQSFASAVCGQQGATQQDGTFYRPFIDSWHPTDRG